MDFEWDERKRLANIAKHKIDFLKATSIFAGPVVEFVQTARDYGEERIGALGKTDESILWVVYTWRGKRRRILSARKAGSDEREKYYKGLIERASQDEGSD